MDIQKMCVTVVIGLLLCGFNTSTGNDSASGSLKSSSSSLQERSDIEANLPANYVPGSIEFASERISGAFDGIFDENERQESAATGGIVPYYYRYLIYDTNEGDYDYIYVFRLPIQYSPSWHIVIGKMKHCACGCYWNITSWGTYWKSYRSQSAFYIEYLFGKGTIDWYTCSGQLYMQYS